MTPRSIRYFRRRKIKRIELKRLSMLAKERELRKRQQRFERAVQLHDDMIDAFKYWAYVYQLNKPLK